MSTRFYLTAFLGGVLVTAALYYPLAVFLPGAFVEGWPAANATLAYVLAGAAALLLALTGAAAARTSGLASRSWAAAAGAVAGLVAAVIAFLWLGAPAAGVYGAGTLLAHGARPAANDAALGALVAEAVVGVHWWTYLGAWLAALTGEVLGALGGALAGPAAPSGTEPRPAAQPVRSWHWLDTLLAAGLLTASLVLTAAVTILQLLGPAAQQAADRAGHSLTIPATSILTFALLTNFANLVAWQAVGVWWLQHVAPSRQVRVAGYFITLLPIATLVLLLVISPTLLGEIIFLIGGVASLALAGLAGRTVWSLRQQPPAPALLPGLAESFWGGLMSGFILYGTAFLGLAAAALNDVLLIVANMTVLGSYDPAVTLPAVVPGMPEVVRNAYSFHLTVLFLAMSIALLLGLVALILAWLLQRRSRPAADGAAPHP